MAKKYDKTVLEPKPKASGKIVDERNSTIQAAADKMRKEQAKATPKAPKGKK